MASWKVIERYIMTPTDPVEGLNALPNNTHRNWIRDRGLQKLNLGIAFTYASSAGVGYTASVINGLLVLPECKIAQYTAKESEC